MTFLNVTVGRVEERNVTAQQHPQGQHENLQKPPRHHPINLIHLWKCLLSASYLLFLIFSNCSFEKKKLQILHGFSFVTQGSSPLPASLLEGQ